LDEEAENLGLSEDEEAEQAEQVEQAEEAEEEEEEKEEEPEGAEPIIAKEEIKVTKLPENISYEIKTTEYITPNILSEYESANILINGVSEAIKNVNMLTINNIITDTFNKFMETNNVGFNIKRIIKTDSNNNTYVEIHKATDMMINPMTIEKMEAYNYYKSR
jgi:hypothetical protein